MFSIVGLVALLANTAHAQEATLQTQLKDFFGFTFSEEELDAVVKLFAADLGTFPVGTSSGAFTWTSDPRAGTFTRAATTFGPLFAERATTMGRRGAYSVGFSYQRTPYRKLEGLDLRNGEVGGTIRRTNLNRTENFVFPAGFEGPFEVARVSLNLTTNRFTLFGTAALTDRLDVSVVIPIQSLAVSGTNTPEPRAIAEFENLMTTRIDATETGFGDVSLRVKYFGARLKRLELASQVEVRLPTGDDKRLLGTGATLTKVTLIASGVSNRFAPHVNIGYVYGEGGARVSAPAPFPLITQAKISNELDYTFGVEVAPHPKLTVIGDVIGRRLFDVAQFSRRTFSEPVIPAGQQVRAYDEALDGLWPEEANVNAIFGSVGAKYNVWGNALLNVTVLFPLTRHGFTPNLSTLLGFEYAF